MPFSSRYVYHYKMKTAKFHFSVDVLPEEDGKGYYVLVPALPGCYSQGKTVEEAFKNIKQAITLHIHALRKNKMPIPTVDQTVHTVIEVAA